MYTKQIAKPGETTKTCLAAPPSVSNEMRQVSSTKRVIRHRKYRG